MKTRDILLALLVTAIWGINFTVISIGLSSFPPLLLAALRFSVAALPAIFLPRPMMPWGKLVALSATLFLGQFALLFSSMKTGMPAGLASVTLQIQAFITILLAAVILKETPTRRQMAGGVLALAGMVTIAQTAGGEDLSFVGLSLCLGAAVCWASGNVLIKKAGEQDMLALVVWMSLIPPVPLLFLSFLMDGPSAMSVAILTIDVSGVGAVLYLSLLSTVLCFGIWGKLLRQYPSAIVAPFSLLVPVFGAASASIVLDETFGTARIIGMLLLLCGLAIVVFPWQRVKTFVVNP